ncbi:hypothetical protein [Amycolatopsis taiwanensis]|uniref:hypothetical protein n=1 Tax=Amycolatopsis taiwanensis TaxID=342230 RepID=UPI00048958CF|nr:hypothetical protein [Amycolatopsis taiwanensis]
MSTEELESLGVAARPVRTRFGRRWRGLTGSLAAGLAALALLVLGSGLVSAFLGAPGPGAVPLIGHPLAAILALAAQRVADRRDGKLARAAGVVIVADVAFVLAFFWWWP